MSSLLPWPSALPLSPPAPGMGEISNLHARLSALRGFTQGRHLLLPLHSSCSPQDQRRAFQLPPKCVQYNVVVHHKSDSHMYAEYVMCASHVCSTM